MINKIVKVANQSQGSWNLEWAATRKLGYVSAALIIKDGRMAPSSREDFTEAAPRVRISGERRGENEPRELPGWQTIAFRGSQGVLAGYHENVQGSPRGSSGSLP